MAEVLVKTLDSGGNIPRKENGFFKDASLIKDKKGIDTHLSNLIIKPYYRDGFGSKSIGEPEWRPHPRNALSVPGRLDNSVRGGNGLDWFSRLRCASLEDTTSPSTTSPRETEQEAVQHGTKNGVSSAREQADDAPCAAPARPVLVEREDKPRQFKPQIQYDTYDDFERIYMRRPLEICLRMSVGAKKRVFDQRNGIPAASLGDKSYLVPEYSSEFHNQGSTRPVINFGGSPRYVPNTFVPLQDLPLKPRVSFEEKEKIKLRRQVIDEVKNLDNWRPADPLTPVMQLPGTHG